MRGVADLIVDDISCSTPHTPDVIRDTLLLAAKQLDNFETPGRIHYGTLLRKVTMILLDPLHYPHKMLNEFNNVNGRKTRATRVGKYRILYNIQEDGHAEILSVADRNEVYRNHTKTNPRRAGSSLKSLPTFSCGEV
jgi:mRNA-degrading endonuclease RelE of RelBE toxin-antitoxin system